MKLSKVVGKNHLGASSPGSSTHLSCKTKVLTAAWLYNMDGGSQSPSTFNFGFEKEQSKTVATQSKFQSID